LGAIRLTAQPKYDGFALAAAFLAAAALLFAAYGSIHRTERLVGLLTPVGEQTVLSSPAAGTVMARLHNEGEFVAAGTPIFQITSDRHLNNGNVTEIVGTLVSKKLDAILKESAARQDQSAIRIHQIQMQMARLAAERAMASKSVRLAQEKVKLAEQKLARASHLKEQGFISAAGVDDVQSDLLEAQDKLELARRAEAGAIRDEEALAQQEKVETAQSALDRATLERTSITARQEVAENDARGLTYITASRSGRISVLNATPGSAIAPGQQLGILTPASLDSVNKVQDAPLYAQFFARSRGIGFIKAGQKVWMRYAAYPYENFGAAQGTVLDVTLSPIGPGELPTAQARNLIRQVNSDEPLYRVDVRLASQHHAAYGQAFPLRPGMQIEAEVVLEERKIWQWLLEPLFASVRLRT